LDLYRINNLGELKELLTLLSTFDINEFEVEADGRKLRISKGKVVEAMPNFAVLPGAVGSVAGAAGVAPAFAEPGVPTSDAAGAEASLPEGVKVIKSPMVGTFYRSSSPEADPFAQVGEKVDDDSILCIIEAMKVMNEISSGISGVVKEVLVENGDSVEFGQALFHIQSE
jgi:acetyl-CoA carboxylase biotin carboxyl carrier protein